MSTIKPFARHGNFIQIDNSIIDDVMPILSANAFKVLLTIIRQTHGWRKDSEYISYSELMERSGVKSRNTIASCTSELIDLGVVLVVKFDDHVTATKYKLNPDFEIESEQKGSIKNEPQVVQKMNHHIDSTRTELNTSKYNTNTKHDVREENQNSNFQSDPIQKFPEITEAVFEALGSLQKSRYSMGTMSASRKAEIQKIVGMLAHENRTVEEIILFRNNWPKFLNKDSPDPPTPRQMLDDFDRVVNWKQRSGGTKKKMTFDEQMAHIAEIKRKKAEGTYL